MDRTICSHRWMDWIGGGHTTRRLKQTFSPGRPTAAMCPSVICNAAGERRSGHRGERRERERERRGTNYSSHELRLRARREMRVRGGGGYPLSSDRERERGRKKDLGETREDARKTSAPRRRRQLWNTKESCDGARDVDPAPRPRQVSTAAAPSLLNASACSEAPRKSGYHHFIPKTKREAEERKEGRKEGRKKGNEGKKGKKEEYLDVFGLPACLLHLCPLSDRSPSSALFSFPHFASVQHCPTALPSPPQGIVLFR